MGQKEEDMNKRIIRLPIVSNAKTCGECHLLHSHGPGTLSHHASWSCAAFGFRGNVGNRRTPNRAQECLDADVTEEANRG